MRYRTNGRQRLCRFGACPGHHDFRFGDGRGRQSRPAGPLRRRRRHADRHGGRVQQHRSPSRSSGAGWPRQPAGGEGPGGHRHQGPVPDRAGPNDLGLSRRHLARAIDASLRRLGTECIDLYQVHATTPGRPSRRRSGPWTTPCGWERSTTWACPTSPGGRCKRRWTSPCANHLNRPVTLQPQYNLLVARDRVGDRPRLPGRGPRPAPVVAAGGRLADRQVPP